MQHKMDVYRARIRGTVGNLESLSPLSILKRGYSITRKIPSFQIVADASSAEKGDKVEVKLYRGALFCAVEGIEKP